MNAQAKLRELRSAKTTKQTHAAACENIREQLQQIFVLKQEKALLSDRLAALSSGYQIEELDTSEDAEVLQRRKILRELKDKLAAYSLIGPCGLSVVEVEETSLCVMFTPMWQTLRETFTLTLVASHDGMEVSSSSIPQFIQVPSLADTHKTNVAALMEAVSLRLVAYVQRKAEVHSILKRHKDMLVSWSITEPVTSVELTLQTADATTEIKKDLTLYLTYSSMDDILPGHVEFSTANWSPQPDIEEGLKQQLLTCPLSSAMVKVVECLVSSEPLVEAVQQQDDNSDT